MRRGSSDCRRPPRADPATSNPASTATSRSTTPRSARLSSSSVHRAGRSGTTCNGTTRDDEGRTDRARLIAIRSSHGRSASGSRSVSPRSSAVSSVSPPRPPPSPGPGGPGTPRPGSRGRTAPAGLTGPPGGARAGRPRSSMSPHSRPWAGASHHRRTDAPIRVTPAVVVSQLCGGRWRDDVSGRGIPGDRVAWALDLPGGGLPVRH